MDLKKFLKRLAIWCLCIPASKAAFGAIDFVVYPLAIERYGIAGATAVIGGMLLALSYLMLVIYEKAATDLFAIEAVKSGIKAGQSRKGLLGLALRQGKIMSIGILALMYQPFKVTIYAREPGRYGISRRDCIVLFLSWIVRTVYWMLAMILGKDFLLRLIHAAWNHIWN